MVQSQTPPRTLPDTTSQTGSGSWSQREAPLASRESVCERHTHTQSGSPGWSPRLIFGELTWPPNALRQDPHLLKITCASQSPPPTSLATARPHRTGGCHGKGFLLPCPVGQVAARARGTFRPGAAPLSFLWTAGPALNSPTPAAAPEQPEQPLPATLVSAFFPGQKPPPPFSSCCLHPQLLVQGDSLEQPRYRRDGKQKSSPITAKLLGLSAHI